MAMMVGNSYLTNLEDIHTLLLFPQLKIPVTPTARLQQWVTVGARRRRPFFLSLRPGTLEKTRLIRCLGVCLARHCVEYACAAAPIYNYHFRINPSYLLFNTSLRTLLYTYHFILKAFRQRSLVESHLVINILLCIQHGAPHKILKFYYTKVRQKMKWNMLTLPTAL